MRTSIKTLSSGRALPLVVVAAFFFALVGVATTQAASGIVGYFQLAQGDSPRAFKGPVQSAVTATGAGGATPGDVYVLDRAREGGTVGRIQQLTAADEFVRLWGTDVVKSGPGNADETQVIRVDATGGTFKLSFGADTTADIAATASAAQVEAVLNGLGSIGPGGVSVSGGPGDAGGTTPYLVSFDGEALADVDQPLLRAIDGSSPLSGGGATANTYVTKRGGSGFEICRPVDGDECGFSQATGDGLGGELRSPPDIAVDQTTGNLYVSNANRVEVYSATGQFIYAWGQDVVASGPDDSVGPDEQKSVTIKATGGTFTLGYRRSFNASVESTGPIPYDAPATAVETALNKLGEIGGNYSSVTVTGGPGDLGGSSPYLITFHGLLGGDDLGDVLVSNANGLTISSGSKEAAVATVADGGGYEICKAADACKPGASATSNGAFSGGESNGGPAIGVVPDGAPNAGNVLAAELGGGRRVQEFTSEGTFIRAFGWDVNATEPSTGFEVCTAVSGDICKGGTLGDGIGQFGGLAAVAADSTGAVYTVEDERDESFGQRVQKFTPAGGLNLTPSPFGTTEIQTVSVNAGAGQFRLKLGSEFEGTTGTGVLTKGSAVITKVNTTKGAFSVGEPIRVFNAGDPVGFIVAVGANTITLNKPAAASTPPSLPFDQFVSNLPYTTSNLPYNASASMVESALNSLPSINKDGGSVSVSGGPGDSTASYVVSFEGGRLARTDMPQISASAGATPLSGGSGPSANTVSVVTTTPGGPNGTDPHGSIYLSSSPFDIVVAPGDRILVAKYFPPGLTTCLDGGPSPNESRIQELEPSGTVIGTSDPCGGIYGFESFGGALALPALTVNPSTGHPYLLGSGSGGSNNRLNIYGPPGPPPVVMLEPVSNVTANGGTIAGTINPNGPGTTYPDVTGTPSSYRTTYRVEYKKASESSWTKYSPDTPLGSGTSPLAFSVGVGGLAPKTPYELKVVAVKPFTATVEEVKSFTTAPAPPDIEAVSSSHVTAVSADLHALINPQGTETTYHFEYGTTSSYGSETPETSIGESLEGQAVVGHIEGLEDTVYHFRVVATNALGTTTSEGQTFTFHPPVCPNQTVRQQTGAAYLPDCRAYELVSPEDAGGTTLYTGGPQSPYASNPPRLAFVGQLAAIPGSGRNPINTAGDLYVATRGATGWNSRYIGPSSEEAGCVGGRPIVSGTGPPRTIQNDVMANPGLSRIVNWNLGNPLECSFGWFGGLRFSDFNTAALGSNAPYVWSAHGDFLDRWPTSAADLPGSEANLSCPQDPRTNPYPVGYSGNIPVPYFCTTYVDASKDLSHFVFSTQSGLFGQGGLNKAPGSAYDNNTVDNTLNLVSELQNGEPIGQEPGAKAGPEELIQFPSVSADGSHILMGTATKSACKQLDYPGAGALTSSNSICPIITQPTHLYMRVNDAVTYDVSSGKAVKYIGSTPDGTKVYFTSAEQLTGDDGDESTDLFMWSENGGAPQLTRVSAGDPVPAGDTDNCVATWTTNCDVETYDDSKISTSRGNQGGLGSWALTNPNPGYTDNAIAAKSGDIYFYSPEQLVAGEGVPGKENLYVYREGSVRHVATLEDDPYCIVEGAPFGDLCSDGAVGRLQVTPDGRYAAFITTSRITAYDNQGFAEMYRYDAQTGEVVCVSCRADGSAPVGDVLGSQGGRFITDDGRVFFNTPEPLDPRDTNTGLDNKGRIAGTDVYEFVDGRPQLITTGTGTGGAGQGFTSDSAPGLYGVSADGVDVYFGTFETLVGQDRNGQQLKFYDARTNGGFSFVPPPAPCAAADECHGPSSLAPGPLANGTGVSLGAGGNARKTEKKRKAQKRKQQQRRKQKQRKRNRAAHQRARGTR